MIDKEMIEKAFDLFNRRFTGFPAEKDHAGRLWWNAGAEWAEKKIMEQAASGFEEWFKEDWGCEYESNIQWHFNQCQAWQAACILKQKEIDDLKQKLDAAEACIDCFYEATKKVGW